MLARWTATVSKTVSHGADGKTIRQNWLELAETLPSLAFTNAVETGLVSRNRESQLRVAIIREHTLAHPTHYIVQVASAPPKLGEMDPGHSYVLASRCLENTPDNDVNLTRFLRDYEEMGAYYLGAGIIQGAGEPLWLKDLMILKRELSLKRAGDVQELDVEAMALRSILNSNKTSEET